MTNQSSYILWRPQNFAKSHPYIWLALHRTKVRWRFCKILWPSQNIWTLKEIRENTLSILQQPEQHQQIKHVQTSSNKRIRSYSFTPASIQHSLSVCDEDQVKKVKGLVQLVPRLYSGWGFLPSQWDRQLKFSAYASFWFLKIWAYLDNFFVHSFQGGTKEKLLKNQCIVMAIFQHFSFGPPLEAMKKKVV